jgi:hypothetical protein
MNAVPRESAVIYYPGYSQQTVAENLQWKTIASISQSFPMIVTTVFHHNYPAGIRVRFQIPQQFGMQELNGQEVQVLAVTSNALTVNLDSSNFSVFAYPSMLPEAYTPPVIIPDASGKYLPPLPLPFGNQTSFEGVLYNNGAIGNPINGM